MSNVLPYQTPPRGIRTQLLARVLKWCALAALPFVVIVVLFLVPVAKTAFRVCSKCGSRQHETRWCLGFTTGSRAETSALDGWMNTHGGHVHDWRFIGGNDLNLLGQQITCRLGAKPPIARMPPDILQEFVAGASPAQITSLVAVLDRGSFEDQADAIGKITDDHYSRHPHP